MSDIKREVISAVKWTWLICVAAAAFYMVVPKYDYFKDGFLRLNRVTGQILRHTDVNDETNELIYGLKKGR